MNIYIFSDNKNIEKVFPALKKNSDLSLAVHPSGDLKTKLKTIEKGAFIYLDISKFEEPERKRLLKLLQKQEFNNAGIIDPKGAIKDPVLLFFDGFSDYIGKDLFKSGISLKRLQMALSFNEIELPEELISTIDKSNYILTDNSWKEIKAGKEYTFCFMFIELDNKKELRSIYGSEQINQFVDIFREHVQEKIEDINGRIWMWHDFGGLILFPFDGKNCNAIFTSLELILNRNIISAEIFDIDIFISYRIALHIGNTVYKKRGDTGKIVSDSINSIFHLGQKYAEPGALYLTKDVSEYIPKNLMKLFIPAGDYEGREIIRMRRPIYREK